MKIIALLISLCFVNQMTQGQSIGAVEMVNNLSGFQNVRDFTMSSNGQEAYITVQSPLREVSVIVQIKNSNDNWIEPKIVPFSGKYNDLEAFLSPDDLRLYFVSNRPLVESVNEVKDFDIWYVERKNMNSEWGSPINMGSPINTVYDEFYPSVSKNSNLYFTSGNSNSMGKDDIFYSVWDKDAYSEPINLGESINSIGDEFNSYVSPEESYIIFSGYNRADGLGSADLYISFRDDSHHWSKAANLGEEINSKYMDYCPFIDSASGVLYFTSRRSAIEKINNFDSIEGLIKEINRDENGLSKIYKVAVDKEVILARNRDQ